MEHMMKEEQLARFEQAVIESAKTRADALVEEARRAQEAALNEAHKQAEAEFSASQKAERERYDTGAAGKADQLLHEKLLHFREELTAHFFDEVQQEVNAYTKTPAYKEALTATLASYAKKLQGEEMLVHLRREDLPLESALRGVCPAARFEADADLRLGGLRVLCGQRVYDESFDTRLNSEKDAFLSYCGLSV